MRITSELLRLHCSVPLEEAEYLDLSDKDIVIIERLSLCRAIRTLILSKNIIKAIQNVDCCRQLWKIDLSGNKLKSLCGLSRFPVLGFVCLGGNELEWQEMHRISHIIILSLTLKGNSKLDSDPFYRHHAVDLLPNVWMLDGQIVTAQERREVEDFFNESQSSLHPVRKKSLGSIFVPTQLKNLLVNGVFGDKTAHMMSRFPINYVHNSEMDKKRLSYLIYSVEDDMRLAHLYHDNTSATLTSDRNFASRRSPNLRCLFELRIKEVEQCNMLLLLMLASLEYSIPLEVLHSTLVTAKLTAIGDIQCSDLFLLPQSMILDIASLLLSATTVDRLDGKEGGLYGQLYRSLCLTMESVQKKRCGVRKEETCTANKTSPGSSKCAQSQSNSRNHVEWNCLLAAEVVHLMCLVPQFFESLQTNEGLLKMTAIATKNSKVSAMIDEIVWKVQMKGGSSWETYQDIASYLLQATSGNGSGRKRKHALMKSPLRKASSQLLHPTQPKPLPPSLRAMSAGETRVIHRRAPKTTYASREPELGDVVVLNDEVARIIALPESRTAVLQINGRSTSTPDNPDSYLYTDTSGLLWDYQAKCWTKDSLASDFSFSHLSDSSCTLPTLASITSLNESILPTPQTVTPTPPPSPYRTSRTTSRPLSGMSHRSDDLQTIPSQEELIEEHQEATGRVLSNSSSPRGVQSSPIKVELGSSTAPSMDTVVSESDHQNHVLQQYALHQTRTPDTDEKLYTQSSPRSQALQLLRKSTREAKEQKSNNSENDNLTIPSLQLRLTEMWESEKSLPTTLSHVRPHSCKVIELDRHNLKIEPHMVPTPVLSTPSSSPLHSSTTENTTMLREKPVLYNAWTVAKPGTPVKQSTLSSTRLMQKRPPKTPPLTLQNQGKSGTGAVAILRSKPEQTNQRKDIHSGPVGKYHYHHPRTRAYGGQNVRKLCKTKTPDFLVGNVFNY